RYADELRSINGELRSFSYIVSHDLRAPLVNIRGFSGELRFATKELAALVPQLPHPQRDVLERTLQGEVAEALEFIESSVTRMDNLINAILRFSRIGRRELKPGTVDAGTVVREVLKSLSHRIERGGTRVQVGELPAVTSDPTAFEQVMGNLLDNAVKYLDPSRPGVITVTAEQGEGEVVFRVADNGRGIAEADLEKVFEIFRRAGRQDVPGEGMGLAYVKALVRRQGGRIWVESVPEQGSVFSFSVPAAPVELQAA
ncbi:MAG TPA: ATP-binding protein, partial [Verrucomicrobiae bacterium]|nr:ATP-binding protein [Verrucomicrobiae bacterium]